MTVHKNGCTGKASFTTFARADLRAKRMRQRKESAHVEAYHCRHCHRFHIGEAPRYRPSSARKVKKD